jgi:hypothetical protein
MKWHKKMKHLNHGKDRKAVRWFKRRCPECEYKSISSKDWKSHRSDAHGDDRPFPCASCDYRSATLKHLLAHQELHTDRPIITCGFEGCDYSTKAWKHLVSHKKVKHLKSGNYICHVCGDSTHHNHHLLEHMESHDRKGDHNWQTCDQCNGLREFVARKERTKERTLQNALPHGHNADSEFHMNKILIDVHQLMMKF